MDEINTVSGADAKPEEPAEEGTVSEGDIQQLPEEPGAEEPEEETTATLPPSADTAAENESLILAINNLQADVNTGVDKLSAIGIALIVIVGFIAGCVWMKGFWTGGKKI